MQKYYGIFDVCYDTRSKGNDRVKKLWMVRHVLEKGKNDEPYPLFFETSKHIYTDRSGDDIKRDIYNARRMYEYGRQYSRCHRFKTKYFIHETDSYGVYKPTKKEIAEAAEYFGIDFGTTAKESSNGQEN